MDAKWQALWQRLVAQAGRQYDNPSGRVGRKLLTAFAAEMAGVRKRLWNSERPLVFLMVVLQRTETVPGAGAIRRRLLRRLDMWERGWIVALVDDTEVEMRCRRGTGEAAARDIIREGRAFEGRVTAGKLREAVRILTNQSGGGPL